MSEEQRKLSILCQHSTRNIEEFYLRE